ncbi:MAG: T9SS sorting signal type C domain-containing protein [Flavobacterium sp.]
MKKFVLLLIAILPTLAIAQSDLARWDGIVNWQPSNVPTFTANYVAAENLTASSNVNLNTNWNGFETSNWGEANAAVDYSKYYQMSIRPTSGASMTVTKIRFKYQGEYRKFEVRYAKNAEFTGSVSLGITNPAQFYNTGTQKDLNVNIPVVAGERLYVRIYVYDKVGGTTWRLLHTNGNHIPPTIVGTVTPPQPLSGTYTIGQSLNNSYKTITEAVAALNALGVQGPVKFLLNDSDYNNTLGEVFPITINQFAGTSATNTVTFKPNNGVTARVDAYNANGTVPVPAVFKINGADNIIFDGSNAANGTTRDLTFDNNSALTYTSRSVIWLVSPSGTNAPENVTIKNAYVQQSNVNGDSFQAMGVYVGADSSAGNGLSVGTAAAKIKNLTISNIDFLNVKEGVYILDNNAASSSLQNVVIEKSDFGGSTTADRMITAVYLSNLNGFTVNKNTITNIYRTHNSGALAFAGIQVAGNSTNGIISANDISKVEKTVANGQGIAGINLSSTSTNTNITVVNNFVLDVVGPGNGGENQNGFGIGIFSGNGYKLHHNTVRLTKSQIANAGISAALFIENNVLNLDVRNNIFVNRQPQNSRRFAIYVATAGQNTFAQLNNNNYSSIDAMGSIGSLYTTANIKTFAQWKTATGKDGNSTTINPAFVSDTDSHIAQFNVTNFAINNTGQALNVTSDIDGNVRNLTTPDVGADEFGNTDCANSTTYNADGTWTNGFPDDSKAVIINGTFAPTTDIYACSLTVTATGSMIMPCAKNLFVINKITVDQGGVLIMENNSDLLQVNTMANSGTITVKRNSSKLKKLDYTLWSSPVTGPQTLLQFSPLTLTNRFYTYNVLTNSYVSVPPATTTFEKGKGYLIRTPDNHPTAVATVYNGSFAGTPTNGTVTVPLTYQDNTKAYNAVGNPYPSPINVSEFIDANIGNIEGTLWFWRKTNDPTKSSYTTLTKFAYVANAAPGGENDFAVDPNGIMNTGQGFIVKAKNAGNIVFTNKMRKANSSNQFFRMDTQGDDETAEPAPASRMWINVSNAAGSFSQAVVGYTADATNDIDNGIDGRSLVDGGLNVYSVVGEDLLAIQGRAEFVNTDVAPLGFRTTAAGTFTFAIDHADGIFIDGQQVFLKDNVTGTLHNLTNGSYTFTSEIGTFNERFELRYVTDSTLGTDNPTVAAQDVIVYQKDRQVAIMSPVALDEVVVYDLLGKVISYNTNVNATEFTTTSLNVSNQVVIVKATTDNGQAVTKKVIIK